MSEALHRLDRSPDLAARAASLFAVLAQDLAAMLPPGADISHVGATAIEGCLTGGGLDVAIRVADADFEAAEAALEARHPRDHGFVQTMDFAAFRTDGSGLPVSLHLAVIGGPFDHFHALGAALVAHPALLAGYNELKEMFEGQPLGTYRAAKGLFINAVLDGVARGEIQI